MSPPIITGATSLAGVIGDPVRHSLSPTLHNAAYAALGLDVIYCAFVVHEGDAEVALAGAKALGFVGLSVTTPHKDAIAKAADQRTHRAEILGAANSVAFKDGASIAECTDGDGLLADLVRACSFRAEGARCAVLGAGGAARAVVLALSDKGASEVAVINRSPERGRIAAALAPDVGRLGALDELSSFDLVVNATSIGLVGGVEAARVAKSFAAGLHEGQLVVDLVYRPSRTEFLDLAAQRGATVRNGLGMLVHQAALQVEFFTGHIAPIDAMWAVVAAEATS